MSHHHTVDFETKEIEGRPNYPPVPVGVAVRTRQGNKRYWSWGHPVENNCTKGEARRALLAIWKEPLLFHHAAFDMEVAVEHLNLPVPNLWDDTLLLAYLHDPRDISLSLKPMADKYLNMPPDEQTRLKEWITEEYMKPRKMKKYSQWGAYIAEAPGKLVGTYAIGDVDRTFKLFNFFYKKVMDAGMKEAYERERRIIGVKLDMERMGIRVAPKLKRDYGKWIKARDAVDKSIRRKLKTGKDFNPNSGPQLADALIKAKKLDRIIKTPTGKVSTKREVLEENCNDKNLIQLLGFNGILGTYIGTFIEPWILSFEANDGKIYPTFNTVRSTDEYGRGGVGTRTGRFSSSRPNFQNVPADVEGSQHEEILLALQKYLRRYDLSFIGLRDYIIPRNGRVFVSRDYSQQELRILGHYEDGELLDQYNANPKMDIHEFIRQLIFRERGILYARKHIKITVFGIVYGMGIAKLAKRMGISREEATKLRIAIKEVIPGIKWLDDELKELCKQEKPMYTWGGRRYYAEEDTWKKVRGEWKRQRWWYKMLNLLIQGSAADATKQGMLNVTDNTNPEYTSILVQVHDELLLEVDKDKVAVQDKLIKEAMEDLRFDVPMLTDAKIGATSWARLKKSGP
jgi:DNA polymerase-1